MPPTDPPRSAIPPARTRVTHSDCGLAYQNLRGQPTISVANASGGMDGLKGRGEAGGATRRYWHQHGLTSPVDGVGCRGSRSPGRPFQEDFGEPATIRRRTASTAAVRCGSASRTARGACGLESREDASLEKRAAGATVVRVRSGIRRRTVGGRSHSRGAGA